MYTINQITSIIKDSFMKTNTKDCAPYSTNPNTDDPNLPDNLIKAFCLSYHNSTTGIDTVTIIYELINN